MPIDWDIGHFSLISVIAPYNNQNLEILNETVSKTKQNKRNQRNDQNKTIEAKKSYRPKKNDRNDRK